MNSNVALRVALVFRGTVVRETTFTRTSEPVVTVGEHGLADFSVPAPGLPELFDMFRRTQAGFQLRVTDRVAGTVTLGEEKFEVEELTTRESAAAIETSPLGRVTVHEVEVVPRDWGVIRLGEVEIFFQVIDEPMAVAGRGFRGRIDGRVMGAIGISMVVHATILLLAFLLFDNDPTLDGISSIDRFAIAMIDDVPEPPEEELAEQPSEDTSAAKAAGEEGVFGEPDEEIPESSVPRNDGEMVEEVDPRDVGVTAALSDVALGSGPLSNIFGKEDGFDDKLDVAMAGSAGELELGRGTNGMGLRGDRRGGGGESIGRIHSIGTVDTGGGGATTARIGPKKERKVSGIVDAGTPKVGDFCDRNDIRRVVAAKQNAVKYCFERELQTKPELSGKIVAQWQVGLDGSVMNASIASSTMNDRSVEGCIARAVEKMRFPAPDGGICVINYPFVFTGLDE